MIMNTLYCLIVYNSNTVTGNDSQFDYYSVACFFCGIHNLFP